MYDGSDRSHHAWTNRSTRITRIDFQYGIMFLKILLIFSPFCLFFCVPACRHTNSVVFGCQFLFLRSHRYDPDKQPADLYPLPLTVTSQSSQSPAFCPVPLPLFFQPFSVRLIYVFLRSFLSTLRSTYPFSSSPRSVRDTAGGSVLVFAASSELVIFPFSPICKIAPITENSELLSPGIRSDTFSFFKLVHRTKQFFKCIFHVFPPPFAANA